MCSIGGVGNDVLIGGQGNDMLTGGAGADAFRFDAKSGNDVILDFDIAQDKLSFAADTGIRSSQVVDLNRDGVADLMLALTGGGSVTFYGVSSSTTSSSATSRDQLALSRSWGGPSRRPTT